MILNEFEISFCSDEQILEPHGRDGCTNVNNT